MTAAREEGEGMGERDYYIRRALHTYPEGRVREDVAELLALLDASRKRAEEAERERDAHRKTLSEPCPDCAEHDDSMTDAQGFIGDLLDAVDPGRDGDDEYEVAEVIALIKGDEKSRADSAEARLLEAEGIIKMAQPYVLGRVAWACNATLEMDIDKFLASREGEEE